MTITLFEITGAEDRRFSPFCWRTRMALAHKGLEPEIVACRFTDKDTIAFSGQGRVPVIRDGERVVSDSWDIASYLEDQYPDRAPLFGGAVGRGEAHFINIWADAALNTSIIALIIKDIFDHLDDADRDYFRTTREKRFGATLEELAARREAKRPDYDRAALPLRLLLERQPFVCGEAPAYGDYIVFGSYQWARSISPYRLIEDGDPIYRWRARMLDLFDGLGRGTNAYPE